MNVITYTLFLTVAYVVCSVFTVIFSKNSKTELRNITIVNVAFALLSALTFVVISHASESLITSFKFITI